MNKLFNASIKLVIDQLVRSNQFSQSKDRVKSGNDFMIHKAITRFFIVTSFASSMLVLPNNANALPFKVTCASMQTYFNQTKWDVPTKFSGFENGRVVFVRGLDISYVDNGEDDATCLVGYIVETSPMGTKSCKGSIKYDQVYKQASWKGDNCRWR